MIRNTALKFVKLMFPIIAILYKTGALTRNGLLNLLFVILKNDLTHFKKLVVFTPQAFSSIWPFINIMKKGLRAAVCKSQAGANTEYLNFHFPIFLLPK